MPIAIERDRDAGVTHVARERLRFTPAAIIKGRSSNHLAVRAPSGRRSVVYVIMRTTKAWQTDVRKGTPRAPEEDESRFWLLVDFAASPTDFYIA